MCFWFSLLVYISSCNNIKPKSSYLGVFFPHKPKLKLIKVSPTKRALSYNEIWKNKNNRVLHFDAAHNLYFLKKLHQDFQDYILCSYVIIAFYFSFSHIIVSRLQSNILQLGCHVVNVVVLEGEMVVKL
jgi:hypothetical protein